MMLSQNFIVRKIFLMLAMAVILKRRSIRIVLLSNTINLILRIKLLFIETVVKSVNFMKIMRGWVIDFM